MDSALATGAEESGSKKILPFGFTQQGIGTQLFAKLSGMKGVRKREGAPHISNTVAGENWLFNTYFSIQPSAKG